MKTPDVLRPVSIDFLYEGMPVRENIYDFSAASLLLPAGRRLTAEMIAKIKKANKYNDCIYVSENTYQDLRKNSKDTRSIVTVNKKLELETGYAGFLDGADDMMKKIASPGKLPKEAVYAITGEVAQRLKITKLDIIFDIINALAPADEYLRRHVINVGLLNGMIGRWLGLPQNDIDMLIMTGLVHDCGKAIIPLEILDAPRRLTLVEFEVIKTHASYSYSLLNGLPETIRKGALHHHEKMDGSGYPGNLHGNYINFAARISSVSDVYDAMVSRRSYKEPLSPFSVLMALSGMRGKELDPNIVDVFIKNMPNELLGKQVLMSDGKIGIINSVDPNDIEYPFVSIDGVIIKTSKDLYCVSML